MNATVDLIATAAVDLALCDQSFIRLAVESQAVTGNDCNGNGVPAVHGYPFRVTRFGAKPGR